MRYYKVEDVIEAVTSLFRVSALFSGMNDNEKEWREKAEKVLAKLPTIEVSEDCISKAYLEQEIENLCRSVDKDEGYWQGWNNALDKVVELIEEE